MNTLTTKDALEALSTIEELAINSKTVKSNAENN